MILWHLDEVSLLWVYCIQKENSCCWPRQGFSFIPMTWSFWQWSFSLKHTNTPSTTSFCVTSYSVGCHQPSVEHPIQQWRRDLRFSLFVLFFLHFSLQAQKAPRPAISQWHSHVSRTQPLPGCSSLGDSITQSVWMLKVKPGCQVLLSKFLQQLHLLYLQSSMRATPCSCESTNFLSCLSQGRCTALADQSTVVLDWDRRLRRRASQHQCRASKPPAMSRVERRSATLSPKRVRRQAPSERTLTQSFFLSSWLTAMWDCSVPFGTPDRPSPELASELSWHVQPNLDTLSIVFCVGLFESVSVHPNASRLP